MRTIFSIKYPLNKTDILSPSTLKNLTFYQQKKYAFYATFSSVAITHVILPFFSFFLNR